METIEEQSKSELSKLETEIGTPPPSPSPSPPPLPSTSMFNVRICLVGDVVNDPETLKAAHTFGVPVIISKTGADLTNNLVWKTHFVVSDFVGPIFEDIHLNKQCILGPPALRQAAVASCGLPQNSRPLYNYAMRGVVTCFTGIRHKEELTTLVNMIHSMGGGIRKDMNSRITHLIGNNSTGDKYQYAKTFRLTVVRPAWVYASWKHRKDINFRATTDEFSEEYKLKIFEGQKVCFTGFPADEHQHMVDVLVANGGIPAELDDAECAHVVMPTPARYLDNTVNNNASVNTSVMIGSNGDMELDAEAVAVAAIVDAVTGDHERLLAVDVAGNDSEVVEFMESPKKNIANEEEDYDLFHERLVIDYEKKNLFTDTLRCNSPLLTLDMIDEDDEGMIDKKNENNAQVATAASAVGDDAAAVRCDEFNALLGVSINPAASTPKSIGVKKNQFERNIALSVAKKRLRNNNQAISPIKKIDSLIEETTMPSTNAELDNESKESKRKRKRKGAEKDEPALKRKLISSDSTSCADNSFAQLASSKLDLVRTGSITRSLRRSISFVAEHTPIGKVLRSRQNSAVTDGLESSKHDLSVCSVASVDQAVDQDISKPIKRRLHAIRTKIQRSNSKKDKYTINPKKPLMMLPTVLSDQTDATNDTNAAILANDGFKTPKTYKKSIISNTTTTTAAAAATDTTTTPKTATATAMTRRKSLSESEPSANIHSDIVDSQFIALENITTDYSTNIKQVVSTLLLPRYKQPEEEASSTTQKENKVNENPNVKNKENNNETSSLQHEPIAGAGSLTTVVDTTATKPDPANPHSYIVSSEWFWYTIQNGYADVTDYLFGDQIEGIANTSNTDRRDSLPINFNNKRKRKRFSQRLQLEGTPLGSGKRRSSVAESCRLSLSSSFFDYSTSPEKLENSSKLSSEPETPTCEQTPGKKASMRFNHFMDFFNTESNYVGILDTIVKLFKNPLDELVETSDALLNKSEIRAIFGNFLPIYEVHQSMLEQLRALQSQWSDTCLIGDIILQHRDELTKAYPPYINYFEKMRENLHQCDINNPRFHAFLKINQTKPECGRQSLQDLMIRPVQRLPSISLLLSDILKYTSKHNPDHSRLQEALKAIIEVMTHINEDKRKMESRIAIFDIFNDIDNCPPDLISSNRNFISKCEVNELSDNLSGRGDTLILCLFSDSIEFCKRRSRGFNSAKSPSTAKSYKHINLMSLNSVRFVVDITDSSRAFALLCRQDKDKLYSFTIIEDDIDKKIYLRLLCKQIAENACRTDTDKALVCRTSQDLNIDISDVHLSTLSKAFKLAARTRLKVGRAFSFNKTPAKLKRAVSSMMTTPFGSTNSLTPASQLAQMRLAGCNNINEDDDDDDDQQQSSPIEVAIEMAMREPSKRKNKSASAVRI